MARRRERRDGPGSYGIIYLTGRETKRTKHCRGVAPQTEPLAEVRREGERERARVRSDGERKEGGERQRELKLGTKVLTFVPSKVFRIMVAAARRTGIERVGDGGRERWRREEDLL